MITRKLITSTVATLAVVAGLSGQALASDNTVSPGAFTTATVSPLAPFGSLQVDISARGVITLSHMMSSMTAAEVTEIDQRCAVIQNARVHYDQQTIAFCDSFFFAQGYDFDDVSD